jgi:hypothetical protein
MAIILKANKVNLFVSSVLCVFWYHSPNVLDTLHIFNISWLRVKLLIMKFFPLPCYLVPLRPKYSPQHPILNTLFSTPYSQHPILKHPILNTLFSNTLFSTPYSQHPILNTLFSNTLINTERKYQASFHYSVLIFVSYTAPCSKPRTLELLHFSVDYKNCGVTGMMTGRESYSAVAMVTGTNSGRRGGREAEHTGLSRA